MCAGNLTDGMPHAAIEGTVFCISMTSNGTVNIVAISAPGAFPSTAPKGPSALRLMR